MNVTTLAMLIVPSATALLIAYLHRKQMRHNELFRLDPKIGVVPPPSHPIAFVKRHWTKVLYCGPLFALMWLYWSHPPISFLTVLEIAFNVSCAAFLVSMGMDMRLASTDSKVISLIEEQLEIISAHTDRIKALEAHVTPDGEAKSATPSQ